MITRREFFGSSVAASTLLCFGGRAGAEQAPGVAADRISFGQVAVLEGAASALGLGMRTGLRAAFAEQNASGGVHGRQLELHSADDGYEPTKSIEATEQMVRQSILALVGPVGTPTSAAAHPIAQREGVPFIGPFTGAELLRNPYQAHVVNVRASYFQETEMMVERLTRDLGHARIAILYQNDAFGLAGLEGAKRALARRGMELAAEGIFERNTTAVRSGLLTIRRANPQSVIMIGPYKPCAEFIKLARQIRFQATFVNISFVGSEALAQELGDQGAGVVVTQVVPFPWNNNIPVVGAYHAALRQSDAAAQPGFISLEGYLVGRTVITALDRIGREVTRQALMAQLTNGAYDFGGFAMSFGPNKNQGSDAVYLTVIGADGRFQELSRLQA
jgi:ABC-type branched-subunit amino acid transport system substrate-binding protein